MKIFLRFAPEINQEPHISEVILETGAKLNINRASVDAVSGEVVVDVPDEKSNEVVKLFRSRGVEVSILEHPVILDKDECINCGACISVCYIKALSFKDDWSIALDEKRCNQCGACIIACPHGALEFS
ncbi:MAG: 4Fe-4S binding protein [Methanocellales archaeon]|nr:4Fe-4S binding protein [Methanocellales archaeon]MDD5446942.1 4Fe-4S binding protein [Methanocellales archaeon]